MEWDFSNYSLDVLLEEPDRLEKSIRSLKDQFDDTMTNNYDYFIKTCESASTIPEDLDTCSSVISDLNASLQSAVSLCEDICLQAETTVASKKNISAAFRHFSNVFGIIDVPNLIEACRVSSLFDEGLQLFQAIESFSRQYPGIPAIQYTLKRAQHMQENVARTLVDSFAKKKGEDNKGITYQESVANVNALRMTGLYTEAQVRLAYIDGFLFRLHNEIPKIVKNPASMYIDKLANLYRTSLMELHTNYEGIFRDDQDDMTLNMAIRVELEAFLKCFCDALKDVKDVSDVRDMFKSALTLFDALSTKRSNFTPKLDTVFYEWKEKRNSNDPM